MMWARPGTWGYQLIRGSGTKGQLAVDICVDVYADGLVFDFVCGDEVHSGCTQLREFLEQRGQAYVRSARTPTPFWPRSRAAARPRRQQRIRAGLPRGRRA